MSNEAEDIKDVHNAMRQAERIVSQVVIEYPHRTVLQNLIHNAVLSSVRLARKEERARVSIQVKDKD